ncbi:hypothetical protein HYU21_00980 [Candidatus Woesearchaeota archaeon]|nr:hypothetical protein [Candidatus Woesearchaeota archaeon]
MTKLKTKSSLQDDLVPVCPKCAGTNLKNIYLMSPAELSRPSTKKLQQQIKTHPFGSPLMGWQPENQGVFICKDCDYNGICPEIEVSQIKIFRKKLKSKK